MLMELTNFFFSSRRRHTRLRRDWSSDVCSSDLFTSNRAGGFGIQPTMINRIEWPEYCEKMRKATGKDRDVIRRRRKAVTGLIHLVNGIDIANESREGTRRLWEGHGGGHPLVTGPARESMCSLLRPNQFRLLAAALTGAEVTENGSP